MFFPPQSPAANPSDAADSYDERRDYRPPLLPNWANLIVLLLLPWLIFLVNRNWPFQDTNSVDPWFYFGGFIHFARYQRLIVHYSSERLMWILPGALLVRIFSPVYGLLALHILFYCISVCSLYFLVKAFADSRTALLTACLLGSYPLFIGANGWAYVDSASTAYFLMALVFMVKAESARSPGGWLMLAGAAWASLVYTYILWLTLTPCFIFFFYYVTGYRGAALSWKNLSQRLVPFLTWFFAGGVALTLCLQMVHWRLYGFGRGFFFGNNITTAFVIIARDNQPNGSGNFHWIWSASWLVVPTLALLVSIGLLVQHARGAVRLERPAIAGIGIYFYVLAVTVIMTIWPVRLLEFDYFANILIAPMFFALGLTIFRVPASIRTWFYPVLALSVFVCVLPLSRPNLYLVAHMDGLALTYLIGAVMMTACIIYPEGRRSWLALMCMYPIVSFALAPEQPGRPWRYDYDGLGATKRVVSAVTKIDRRLPLDAYPAFWIDKSGSPYNDEYRAIMCMFLSHMFSMKTYPEVDPNQAYRPGTFLILVTDRKDVFGKANEKMTQAGMPLALYGQDLISANGVSYWLTYTRVLRRATADPLRSALPPPIVSIVVGRDAWPQAVSTGRQMGATVSLAGSESRELFRSVIGQDLNWEVNTYGRSGGLRRQSGCGPDHEACGVYTSGDPRDHMASDFVEVPPSSRVVFFSIWVKQTEKAGGVQVVVQDEDYHVLAEGHELASSEDGWCLYGNWLNAQTADQMRLVIIGTRTVKVLLAKAELIGISADILGK